MLTINFDCNSWKQIHSKSNHWSDRFQGSFDAIALYLCRLSLSFTVLLVSSFFLLMSHVPVVDVVSDRSIRVLHLLVLYFFSFYMLFPGLREGLDSQCVAHLYFPASVWMFYGVSNAFDSIFFFDASTVSSTVSWLYPFGFCSNAILFTSRFSSRER